MMNLQMIVFGFVLAFTGCIIGQLIANELKARVSWLPIRVGGENG